MFIDSQFWKDYEVEHIEMLISLMYLNWDLINSQNVKYIEKSHIVIRNTNSHEGVRMLFLETQNTLLK